MITKRFAIKLRTMFREFCRRQDANVLITFAFALVPVLGFVGAGVDYSRANFDKAAMQAAADATALMLSKNAATLTPAQINQQATSYFNANFNRPDVANITVTPTYTTSGGSQIVLTATGTVATTFLHLIGVPTINVGVSTKVAWGNTRLRLALVLDNTGSMAQSNKMTALKTAAKNLLAQLQSAASQSSDVYVSIIPFSKDVNVDPVNYNQYWIKWSGSADTWDENNGTCSKSGYTTKSTCLAQGTCSKTGYTTQSTCVAQGTCSKSGYTTQSTCVAQGACSQSGYTTQSTCVAQGTCSKSTYTTQSTCTSHSGTWTPATWTPATWTPATWTFATWAPKNHNTWNGCVMDRDQNFDTTNTAPVAGNSATLFPAEQYSYCPVPLMGLSNNWTALNAKIDAMTPTGATNQAIGLQWGFLSLTSAPFSIPPMDQNYQYQQIIILLTDGLNTQNRWYGNGSDPAPQVDARQKILCDNINAAGITLYAVQVNTGNDPTSQLLQNCAGSPGKYSDSSKFFLLTTSGEIVTTFNQIGTAIMKLRIVQ